MAAGVFVEADIWTLAQTDQGNVVLVRPKGSELAVPIFIGQLETQSILIGMGGVDVPRPLTHDLVLNLLHLLGASLRRVEINDLREGTFYARLILAKPGGNGDLVVDARPSDAIGLAVRAGCPVFIAESVVDEAGISVNLVNGGAGLPGGSSSTPAAASSAESTSAGLAAGSAAGSAAGQDRDSERESLLAALESAVAAEEYEEAARIRDRLKELGLQGGEG